MSQDDYEAAAGPTIRTGKLVVNLDTRVVSVDDRPVHLTGKEYGILELLSLHKGTTITKEMFLNHLYGGVDEPELKIIDVFVCKLRKKLPGRRAAITTSRPYGAAAICLASRRRRQGNRNRSRGGGLSRMVLM